MNNNGFDLLYNLNNKNNTFISLSGTLIKNVPEPKMRTLNSFMKVIPIKMNQGLIEEPRPLSTPKKKKKKNKHIKILAKNKKKKESKKVTSSEKSNKKIKEQSKNESSRTNKFSNTFMRKTYFSKSESNKYEKKKKNQKDNSYIDTNTSLNNSNQKIKNEDLIEINNLKKFTAHNKYKPDLNTIQENETKPKMTKKNKSSTNIKIEDQKINNIYLRPKILFQEKLNHINYQKTQNSENKKINISQINNQLNKSITQKPNSDIKEILSMNSTHNIEFTTSYRNEIVKPTHQKRLSSVSSSDFSEKIKKINKNIINSYDSSKSINSINNNNIAKKINNNNNNNTNEKKDKNLNNTIPFKPFKVKSSEIKNLIQKEDISERIMRIRKSFQEKEMHQSRQNLNLHFYLILPGNASYLIKNCMNHRTNWKEPFSKVTSLYNFKWQELSYGIEYGNLSKYNTHKQIVNHYENHYCISNKANMFCYLMKYCEERKISIFKYVPFTIIYKIKEKRKDKENQIKNFEKENQENKDNLRKFINMSDKFVVDYNDIGNYYDNDVYIKEIEKRKIIEEENKNIKKKKKKDEKKKEEQKNEEKKDEGYKKDIKKEEENKEIKKEEIKSEEEIKKVKDENKNEKIKNIDNIEIKNEEKKNEIIYEEENNINNNNFKLNEFYSDFFPKLKPNDRIVLSSSETLERERKEKKKEKKRKIGNYTLIELPKSHETGKHMWIVKAINLNRGKCIKVVNSFEQIEKVIDKFKFGVKYDFTEQILEKNEEKEKNYQDECQNNSNETNIKNNRIINNNIDNNVIINHCNSTNSIDNSKNNNINYIHFNNINNINKNFNNINLINISNNSNINKNMNNIQFFNNSNTNNINKNYNSINCINISSTNNNTIINTSINNGNITINNNESPNNNTIINNEIVNHNNTPNNIKIPNIINFNNLNNNNNEKNNNENNNNNNNNENNNNNNENNNNNNENNNNDNKNSQDEKMYLCKKIIIQKYIENPLLYKGRKCDIRIWVLLTHKMKVYVFKEGHLKTCSVDYDVNSKDAFTHITNYSLQKHNNNFEKFEKGNEVPFYEFQKFINEKYPEKNYSIKTNLMKKIKKIINLTMRAGKEKINKNNRNYQFEIFGYDFMLDINFNVFLIEINTNPGIEESSPWIKIIIPRMLDDALRLTIDLIFEPKYDFNLNYKNEEDQNNIDNVNNNLKHNIDPNTVIDNNNELNNEEKKNDNNNKNKENDNKNNENKEKINDNNNENLKENNNEDKNINNNENKTIINNQINNNENNKDEENKVNENKNNLDSKDNNNQKYISPFPVPGYSLSENLWELVCDLNEKDPLDDRLDQDNEKNDNQSFTGIKHLMKRKRNTIKK